MFAQFSALLSSYIQNQRRLPSQLQNQQRVQESTRESPKDRLQWKQDCLNSHNGKEHVLFVEAVFLREAHSEIQLLPWQCARIVEGEGLLVLPHVHVHHSVAPLINTSQPNLAAGQEKHRSTTHTTHKHTVAHECLMTRLTLKTCFVCLDPLLSSLLFTPN